MSWLERLENLQSRSEESRRRIAFWSAAGVTAVVAVVWVTSLSFTLSAWSSSAGPQVAAIGEASPSAREANASAPSDQDFFNQQKEKIIAGWKIITRSDR